MRKIYKEVETENGKITIWGSNRWVKLHYAKPDWADEEHPYFNYENRRHYLDEILSTHNRVHSPNLPQWMKEFDGYTNDSLFSGTLIKLSEDGESVKAFTFCS